MSGSSAGMTTRIWDFSLLDRSVSRDSPSDLSSREAELIYMMPKGYQEAEEKL